MGGASRQAGQVLHWLVGWAGRRVGQVLHWLVGWAGLTLVGGVGRQAGGWGMS